MKFIYALGPLLIFATVASALPPGGGTPLPPIGDNTPPSAAPLPGTDPFVDSVNVTLTADKGADIYYDFQKSGSAFDTTTTAVHHYTAPVHITANTHLRAVAYYGVLGASPVSEWDYAIEPPPTATLQNPVSGQVIRQGTTLTFSSIVQDQGGKGIAHVTYERNSPGSLTWETVATGTTGPNYAVDWSPTGNGTYNMRATAFDALGAHGSSAQVTVNVTPPNQAPTVAITSPANGASYISPATVSIAATANDPDPVGGAISKVEFYQSGSATPISTKLSPPYTYDWTNVPSGDYTITAKAYDNASPPLVTSSSINISVHANRPPRISITSPANGAFYYAPATDTIKVSTSDSDGSISKVEYYNGAVLDTTVTVAPYTIRKTNVPAGVYKVTAKAYDNLGASTVSDTVVITVAANQPPVARAGNDTLLLPPTNSTVLHGGASSDPEGTQLSYLWTGPAGTSIANANTANPFVQFSGTGSYTLTLKVTDAGTPPMSSTDQIVVTVGKAPIITSSLSASGVINAGFSYTMTATGIPAPTMNASGMPAWLGWNASTAVLSGTPPALGTFPVTLSATSASGTDTKTLNITIGDSLTKPTITSPLTAVGKTGTGFNYTITAKGTTPVTFGTSTLPGGLSLSGAVISGTPTASGAFNITLTAQNSLGNDSKALALTLNADPKITVDLKDSLSVYDKSRVVFSVGASGYPAVTYQWQFAGAGTFINIGTGGASYTLDTVSPSSAGRYRVLVRNGSGPDAVSNECRLIVKPLPAPIVIRSNPVAITRIKGNSATFQVRATGDPPLLYQWFHGATAVSTPSAMDSDFVIDSVQIGDGGLYRAKVTNAFTDSASRPNSLAYSDTARLSVQLPKLPKPYANRPGTNFYPVIYVTLTNDTPGTNIFYTLDGTDPTQIVSATNIKYTPGDSIKIDTTLTLKAKSYKNGFRSSDPLMEAYTFTQPGKVAKPVARPPDSLFTTAVNCTLTTTTPQAAIYYTLDGSDPSGAAGIAFKDFVPITATTTIKAIAKKTSMINSDVLVKTYTLQKPMAKALAPQATPAGGPFTVQQTVALSSATDSALIWYTTDGSNPDTSATRQKYVPGTTVLKLTTTTTVKAQAVRNGFLNSDITSETYTLVPGPITSNHPDTIFDVSINIILTAQPAGSEIHFTTDGSQPSASSPQFPAAGIKLTETTTLTAVAIMGGVTSQNYSFSYTLKGGKLSTPLATTANNAVNFKDTLRISLSSTPGADIYYTTNGDIPNVSSQHYDGPFVIDTTVTLQAIAMEKYFEDSKIMSSTFTLVPDMPVASPAGGHYASARSVTLTSSSKRAGIFYTLDGSAPTPQNGIAYKAGKPISITGNTTLKAVAVAGNIASSILEEVYSIFADTITILRPGETYYLEGGYAIRNPEDQATIVKVRLSNADSLNLQGFSDVQYSITLSLDETNASGAEFPKLVFASSPSEQRSMYKVDPSGKVYFLSSADSVTFSEPGVYFMGIDTSPPIVSYLGESFDGSDSTVVKFKVQDNVANLAFDLKRSDDPDRNISQAQLLSPADTSFKLKNPAGSLKPLTLQFIVHDYHLTTFFPADQQASLALSQRMGAITSPPVWAIGTNGDSPWDLISIPLDMAPPISLKDFLNSHFDMHIEGAGWIDSIGDYMPMDPAEKLLAGHAYWLASHSVLKSFSWTAVTTAPQGDKPFSVKLKHGWNQVGNPSMTKLYWPTPRNSPDAYRNSGIKGLWSYLAKAQDYTESDSLEPWRGYFVYNYFQDTTVELLTSFPPRPSLKSASENREIDLSVGWGGARNVRLGATGASHTGIGWEDEMELPWHDEAHFLRAVREGRGLAADWIHFEQDGIAAWKIAMGAKALPAKAAGASGSSGVDSLPSLKILSQQTPAGYETWAVSLSRSMKFKMEVGSEIPASGLAKDTLLVFSGPAEKMASFSLLKNLPEHAPPLDANIAAHKGGFALNLNLPVHAKIHAILWGLDGMRKGDLNVGTLAEGYYRFTWENDFHQSGRALTPGVYFLTLEIRGAGLPARIVEKIILRE